MIRERARGAKWARRLEGRGRDSRVADISRELGRQGKGQTRKTYDGRRHDIAVESSSCKWSSGRVFGHGCNKRQPRQKISQSGNVRLARSSHQKKGAKRGSLQPGCTESSTSGESTLTVVAVQGWEKERRGERSRERERKRTRDDGGPGWTSTENGNFTNCCAATAGAGRSPAQQQPRPSSRFSCSPSSLPPELVGLSPPERRSTGQAGARNSGAASFQGGPSPDRERRTPYPQLRRAVAGRCSCRQLRDRPSCGACDSTGFVSRSACQAQSQSHQASRNLEPRALSLLCVRVSERVSGCGTGLTRQSDASFFLE